MRTRQASLFLFVSVLALIFLGTPRLFALASPFPDQTTLSIPANLQPITPANGAKLAQVATLTLKMGSTPLSFTFHDPYTADTLWMQNSFVAARSVTALAINSAGKVALVAGSDIQLFDSVSDLYKKNAAATLDPGQSELQAFALSPEGDTLALVTGNQIILWDVTTNKATQSMSLSPATLNAKAIFSPDGSLLAVSGPSGFLQDFPIYLIDVVTGTTTLLSGLKGDDYAGVFSTDGKQFAAGAYGTPNILVWSLPDGKLETKLPLGTQGFSGLAFSPDGRILAVGTNLGEVNLFDLSHGSTLATYSIDGLPQIGYLSFSPDGSLLLSFEASGTARFWGTSVDGGALQMPATAEAQATLTVPITPNSN